MKFEDHEKVFDYDLGMMLEDCAYTSSKQLVEDIEQWWGRYGDFILQACLEKVNRSSQRGASK